MKRETSSNKSSKKSPVSQRKINSKYEKSLSSQRRKEANHDIKE